jgi:hypothetical protein
MLAYYCHNLQAKGEEAICATLEKAKEWMLASIARTAGDDGQPGDKWDGWGWWVDEKGTHCFGGTEPGRFGPCAEGIIRELPFIS